MEEIINNIWTNTIEQFNTGNKQLSSEKSLVFNYAWNLQSSYASQIVIIDFERSVFDDFSDGSFLDLYFEIKYKNQKLKVGIEFKYPHNNGGNTNQTQTRQKCVNDLKRLNWLVSNKTIDLGAFLMVTNEAPYINEGNKSIDIEFKTYHKILYKKDSEFPVNEKFIERVAVLNDQRFEWNNIEPHGKKGYILKNKFAWINPILVKSTNA